MVMVIMMMMLMLMVMLMIMIWIMMMSMTVAVMMIIELLTIGAHVGIQFFAVLVVMVVVVLLKTGSRTDSQTVYLILYPLIFYLFHIQVCKPNSILLLFSLFMIYVLCTVYIWIHLKLLKHIIIFLCLWNYFYLVNSLASASSCIVEYSNKTLSNQIK